MWQKKGGATEAEQKPQPALALRPAGSRPPTEASPFAPLELENHKGDPRRAHRLPWILGIGLLACTAAGAALTINNSLGTVSSGPGNESAAAPLPDTIVALGMADNDPKIRDIRSLVSGEVVEVAPEGKDVKEGEVLLRLDQQYARLQIKAAVAALGDARIQLEVVRILPLKHDLDKKTQENAIAIAEHKKDALFHELETKRDYFKQKLISIHALGAFEDGYKAAERMIEVEKNKLEMLNLRRPQLDVDRAKLDVDAKEAQLERAKVALEKCTIIAPSDGTILRVFVSPGEGVAPDAKIPAIQFCPRGKRIIRAEVLQEWASHVGAGQKVVIEDDTRSGSNWYGTVTRVSDWITHKRNVMIEPFMVNDVRTLECLIDVHPGGPPLRIGQRVRVTIQQSK